MKTVLALVAVLAVAVACGGGKGGGGGGTTPGDTHEGEGVEGGVQGGMVAEIPADAGLPDAEPPKPRAPVTFVIKNEGKTDLTFALDKGWGGAVFAYSGKPPKATPLQVFAKACTGACDGSTGDVCPICKEADDPSERQKQEKEETKREVVPAGGTFELEWDGLAYAYEKAPKEVRGKNKKCECWKKAPPAAATYTIKACALRTASAVGETSKFECVETTVDLPVAEGQTVNVELVFTGKPPAKTK